ncbi:MAG TPA: MnmC family methyltransferase [Candidatus Saccharimonadales bacterium]|nr:MnmC family methyltransferase [Candidatus Saccharimonadales bacterium]
MTGLSVTPIRSVFRVRTVQNCQVSGDSGYRLVQLRNGVYSVHSLAYGETMHPGLGPEQEGRALYVDQLRLLERMRGYRGEFVVWDVGLGAAANALSVLQASAGLSAPLRIVSFDSVLEPLAFAFANRKALGYFEGCEYAVETLLRGGRAEFRQGERSVVWETRVTDFPSLVQQVKPGTWGWPHVILFDPWSPARNPAMWTAAVLSDLFRLLDPATPCAMPTYSRSTMLRVSLLLAGWWVGAGKATGRKEETTIAANVRDLIDAPLDRRWLARASRSKAAEPLWEPRYRQAPLAPETWERLRRHPQFQ